MEGRAKILLGIPKVFGVSHLCVSVPENGHKLASAWVRGQTSACTVRGSALAQARLQEEIGSGYTAKSWCFFLMFLRTFDRRQDGKREINSFNCLVVYDYKVKVIRQISSKAVV